MVIDKPKVRNYCTVVLVLIPLIGQYGVFTKTLTFADVAIIPAILVVLLFHLMGKYEMRERIYPVFAVWYLLTALIISPFWRKLFSAGTLTSVLQNAVYFATVILVAPYFFDCNFAVKVYSKVVIVLCVILFIQAGLHLTTGSVTPWILNSDLFPAVYVSDDFFDGGYLETITASSYRPASLFSEPALFAQYVTPCLILNIYTKEKTWKNYFAIVLTTVSVLLAGSANGIVYILIAWGFAGIYNLADKFTHKESKITAGSSILILLAAIFLPKIAQGFTEVLSLLFARFSELFDLKGISSGSLRVIRGWKIFLSMSFIEQLLGIGTGNVVPYLSLHSHIVPIFVKAYNGYMSGLSAIFVNSGIIGGFLYLSWWVKYFFSRKAVVKGLQVFLMLYLLASFSFNTYQFILTMVVVIALEKQDDDLTIRFM